MIQMTTCGRCHQEVRTGEAETCWYCLADLCYACWDDAGHCGHPEAKAIHADTVQRVREQATPPDAPGSAVAGEGLGAPRSSSERRSASVAQARVAEQGGAP